jgi:hypothetical protein
MKSPAQIATLLASVVALVLARPAGAQQAPQPDLGSAAPAAQEENSGQDPTRPVTRVDLRLKYQDNPGGRDAELLTLRADKPFVLAGGWKVSTRADLPFVRNNAISADNIDGDHEIGFGDVLLQALVITPPHGKAGFAFGTQLILPTGTKDQFTSGKWQLGPTVAAVYQLPEVSPGSFVALLVRDSFSFAGDHDRPGSNVLSVQPIFNAALPDKWFLTFGPEAKFNTRDQWKLFVPFDVTVGTKLDPRTVVSLQADVPIINEFKQYDWQAEFRIGFFF